MSFGKRLRLILLLASITGVLSGLTMPAVAATGNKSGVTIAPPFQEITILPHQTSLSQNFGVTNNNDTPVTFDLSTIDMGALDESGGVVFSGLSADYQQKYGLAKWVQLETPAVTVAPHATQSVNFTIVNDPTLSPGGHYGAIVINPQGGSGGGSNKVSLTPQAATLLFVRKIGGEIYGLDFVSGTSGTSWWQLPRQLTIKLKNTGNVHVVPRGYALLEDSHGNQIGKGIINPESSLILPERVRDYTVSWQQLKRITWPGKYTVDVFYRYDGVDKFQHAVYAVTFINIPFIFSVAVIIAALLWLVWRAFPGLRQRVPRPKRRAKESEPKPVPRQKIMSMRSLDQNRNSLPKPATKSTKKANKKPKKPPKRTKGSR